MTRMHLVGGTVAVAIVLAFAAGPHDVLAQGRGQEKKAETRKAKDGKAKGRMLPARDETKKKRPQADRQEAEKEPERRPSGDEGESGKGRKGETRNAKADGKGKMLPAWDETKQGVRKGARLGRRADSSGSLSRTAKERRKHLKRLATIERLTRLGAKNGNRALVEKAERLLEKERRRYRKKMNLLQRKAPARERPATRKEVTK